MSVKVKCVHCGTLVDEFAAKCPSCGKPPANRDAPTDVPDAPSTWRTAPAGRKTSTRYFIIAVVAVILVAAAIYFIQRI